MCRPYGPLREPPVVGGDVAAAVTTLTAEEVGGMWVKLTAAVEAQLCAVHDLVAEPAG